MHNETNRSIDLMPLRYPSRAKDVVADRCGPFFLLLPSGVDQIPSLAIFCRSLTLYGKEKGKKGRRARRRAWGDRNINDGNWEPEDVMYQVLRI